MAIEAGCEMARPKADKRGKAVHVYLTPDKLTFLEQIAKPASQAINVLVTAAMRKQELVVSTGISPEQFASQEPLGLALKSETRPRRQKTITATVTEEVLAPVVVETRAQIDKEADDLIAEKLLELTAAPPVSVEPPARPAEPIDAGEPKAKPRAKAPAGEILCTKCKLLGKRPGCSFCADLKKKPKED